METYANGHSANIPWKMMAPMISLMLASLKCNPHDMILAYHDFSYGIYTYMYNYI